MFSTEVPQSRYRRHECLRKHVDRQAGVLRIPTSKNGDPRVVPLNETATRVLQEWWHREPIGPRVFPVNAQNFYNRVFAPAVQAAGLEDFRWHDLRHTFASRLVMGGVPLQAVQQLLGHRTLAMTMRYAHLAPGYLKSAVAVLDAPSDRTATKQPPVG